MKKLLTVLVMVLAFNLSNAQKIISPLTTDVTFFEFETAKNGIVDVNLTYADKVEGQTMDNETLNTIVNYVLNATQIGLKSRRSFVPLSITVKYKYNEKGKHRYGVTLSYAGTNTYGGEVEEFIMFEFNHKLKETVGSVMLRMNQ